MEINRFSKIESLRIGTKNKPVVSVKVISLLLVLKIELQLSVIQSSDKTFFDGSLNDL